MDNLMNVTPIEIVDNVNKKSINTTNHESVTKTHPRMYSIGILEFQNAPAWSYIDIPVSVKTDILRAIEEAGYSITYMDDDMVSINAIKKQLQHDA